MGLPKSRWKCGVIITRRCLIIQAGAHPVFLGLLVRFILVFVLAFCVGYFDRICVDNRFHFFSRKIEEHFGLTSAMIKLLMSNTMFFKIIKQIFLYTDGNRQVIWSEIQNQLKAAECQKKSDGFFYHKTSLRWSFCGVLVGAYSSCLIFFSAWNSQTFHHRRARKKIVECASDVLKLIDAD